MLVCFLLLIHIIYKNNLQPDLIISSPAKRAKQTSILIKAVAEIKAEIEYREELYGARPTAFLEVTSTISEDINSVLIIGHNPEIENFIRKLTGEQHSMSTASIAVIELRINKWKEISSNVGQLQLIARPKELMERVEIESSYELV